MAVVAEEQPDTNLEPTAHMFGLGRDSDSKNGRTDVSGNPTAVQVEQRPSSSAALDILESELSVVANFKAPAMVAGGTHLDQRKETSPA